MKKGLGLFSPATAPPGRFQLGLSARPFVARRRNSATISPPRASVRAEIPAFKTAGRRGRGTNRESGQGTVEYILVLVIVIIILLTVMYRFHHGFRTYARAFFNGYVACLLESGELPGAPKSTCAEVMPKFDDKNAKELIKGNIPGGAGGAGGANAGNKQDKNKNANRGRETVAGGSRSAPVGSLRGSGRPKYSEVAKNTTGDGDASKSNGDSLSMPNSSGARGRAGDRPRGVRMNVGSSEVSEDEAKEKDRPKKAQTTKKVENGDTLRPTRSIEKTDRKPTALPEEDGKGFSMGALIRWLIILLIIVAIVVFFGGQLIQISKSREKGE